jgi:predicted phosphoribosyltransferase
MIHQPFRVTLFRDRQDAARLLVERLRPLAGDHPLVLGIPRGGIAMAAVLAEALGGELGIVLVHKLSSPESPEIAIGSVDESGAIILNELGRRGVPADWVHHEAQVQLSRLHERRRALDPEGRPLRATNRTVIVVDDGAATGSTMAAALTLLRRHGPERLIAAIAVAPTEAVADLEWLADDVVCLATPPEFLAVAQFFEDFSEVNDEQAARLLHPRPSPQPANASPEPALA